MSKLTLSERMLRDHEGKNLCDSCYEFSFPKDWIDKAAALEQSLAAAQEENRKFLALFSDYEMPCQDFEMAENIWNSVLSKRNELRDENRKLREQDRRNEVTMGELRRAWEGQNVYITKLCWTLKRNIE